MNINKKIVSFFKRRKIDFDQISLECDRGFLTLEINCDPLSDEDEYFLYNLAFGEEPNLCDIIILPMVHLNWVETGPYEFTI